MVSRLGRPLVKVGELLGYLGRLEKPQGFPTFPRFSNSFPTFTKGFPSFPTIWSNGAIIKGMGLYLADMTSNHSPIA